MTTLDPPRRLVAKDSGWIGLFRDAFRHSRNPMVLLDDRRCHTEVNGAYLSLLGYPRGALIGHPVSEIAASGSISERDWRAALRRRQFAGVADLRCDDGGTVRVEFAGHPEVVSGRHLVLVVALRTTRGLKRLSYSEPQRGQAIRLTRRERDVVALVAFGLTSVEIASELHITTNTVRTHVRNAMTKLEARSRAQLVARAMAAGECWDLDPPPD